MAYVNHQHKGAKVDFRTKHKFVFLCFYAFMVCVFMFLGMLHYIIYENMQMAITKKCTVEQNKIVPEYKTNCNTEQKWGYQDKINCVLQYLKNKELLHLECVNV